MKLYAIKDTKIGYMNPWLSQNDVTATRTIQTAVNDTTPNSVNQYPKDMELWSLGSYDADTGIITPELNFLTSCINLLQVGVENV